MLVIFQHLVQNKIEAKVLKLEERILPLTQSAEDIPFTNRGIINLEGLGNVLGSTVTPTISQQGSISNIKQFQTQGFYQLRLISEEGKEIELTSIPLVNTKKN